MFSTVAKNMVNDKTVLKLSSEEMSMRAVVVDTSSTHVNEDGILMAASTKRSMSGDLRTCCLHCVDDNIGAATSSINVLMTAALWNRHQLFVNDARQLTTSLMHV